jgi:hypothetical protein
LVIVISLDEEEPRAMVTPNINLVEVEAKALTAGMRHRTCCGGIGFGVVGKVL